MRASSRLETTRTLNRGVPAGRASLLRPRRRQQPRHVCNVLTLTNIGQATGSAPPSPSPAPAAPHSQTIVSPSQLAQQLWSFLTRTDAATTDPIDLPTLVAPADEAAPQLDASVRAEIAALVHTASKSEVKHARLYADLSDMAYDTRGRVTPAALRARHHLALVAKSDPTPAQSPVPSPAPRTTPPTTPHATTLKSNIVPFPRPTATTSAPRTTPAAATAAPRRTPSTPAAEPTHPLQWFIADALDEPLRIFSLQGSVNFDHWKINLDFEPADFEHPAHGVKVHRGVYQTALSLYPAFLPHVTAHLAAHPGTARVTFTGHSLGGSVATVLLLLFVARGVLPPSAVAPVHTFGAPAVFCDGATAAPGRCSACQLACPRAAAAAAAASAPEGSGNGSSASTSARRAAPRRGRGGAAATRPWSSCAGLLAALGLPETAVRNVVMHHDIVPRAFACDYSNVAQLLQQWGPAFRAHAGLSGARPHKVLYSFLGTVHILQPDRRHKFVLGDAHHPLLPPRPALYTVHRTDTACDSCAPHDAVLHFMNSPHPLAVLQSAAAYGASGAISRYHNPDNYTKALFGLLRRW